MPLSNTPKAFFELVRAGLWERDARLLPYQETNFSEIYRLAEEQSVVGLVTAGLEHVVDMKVPQADVLTFVGSTLQIELRNKEMNLFIASLIDEMRKAGIYTLLVKGQGVAQCYERPLWRASGDVDLLLSNDNYHKAKAFLTSKADYVDLEDKKRQHLGLFFGPWEVELHGSLRTEISRRMNRVIDETHHSIFYGGNVRSWLNTNVQVFLPSADNDVIIVFTHFIDHFYGEGIGLRQICDWCRLLWTNSKMINHQYIDQSVRKMGLITEWKAFAAFAVDYLGMPPELMPLYTSLKKYKNKAEKISVLVLETGNLGHNKDNSYRLSSERWKINCMTFLRRLTEFTRISTIFPVNAPKFFFSYFINRLRVFL